MKRSMVPSTVAAALLFLAPATIAAPADLDAPAADNTRQQYRTFRQAQQQEWQKTAELRRQVRLKHSELATLWLTPTTTQEALLKKQRELQDARAALEREQLSFMYRMKQQYGFDFDHYGVTGHGCDMGQGMMDDPHGGHGMSPDMGHGMGQGM